MSLNNKVIWTEGMFLRPSHFQQQERYFQHLIESRCVGLQSYSWGLSHLEIDQDLLKLGKFAITSCQGVFPDGTPFSMPDHHPTPIPLEVPSEIKNQTVFLSLPVSRPSENELDWGDHSNELSRFQIQEIEVKDVHSKTGQELPTIESGKLQARFRLSGQNQGGFVSIPIAKIIERTTDKLIVLEKEFIPTSLHVSAANQLIKYMTEIEGKLNHQGSDLAKHLGTPGSGGVAEIEDFLLLQIVNRYEPLFIHFNKLRQLHPEQLYRILVQMAGELATMTEEEFRPKAFPDYQHEDLTSSFAPVIIALRKAFDWRPYRSAIQIRLEERPHQVRLAMILDRELLVSAEFVLAANAQIPTDTIRTQLPSHTHIATTEKLKEIVFAAVPGIRLKALPVAPRQIPFHKGMTYFVLDKDNPLWKEMEKSGTIAMHFSNPDGFPGLELEFWAIRGK